MIDLLVVGGGPVGLATAIDAAQRGLEVVVAERRAGDGDKACGEGLMPSSLHALARLGVDPPGEPIRGIRYISGDRAVESRFRGDPGRGVRRVRLVKAMRHRADQVGVRTVQATVSSVRQRADGTVDVGDMRARYVAAADGLHSPIRRGLGLDAPSSAPSRFGVRRHYRREPWTDLVEVHWAEDCEAYVTPVGHDEVGVAILSRGGEPFDAWLTRFPRLLAGLGDSAAITRDRGAGPLRQHATRRVEGHVMLVGDAAGYVDALTGEGMAVGFASASALVRCVVSDSPTDYEQAWARATRRPRLITEALLRATQHPRVRHALVPAAQRIPLAFDAAVNALA